MSSSKSKSKDGTSSSSKDKNKDKSQVHKLSLKGSARMVAEFFHYSIHTILFQRGVYPAEDFSLVKKYGLSMLVSADDQVKAYVKKIMSQLDRWMVHGKISRLVVVITNKDTGEHVERWQFDVQIFETSNKKASSSKSKDGRKPQAAGGGREGQENFSATGGGSSAATGGGGATVNQPPAPEEKNEKQIQDEIAAIFRQITASVTFLPQLDAGACTFNVLVYADADSDVPVEWGDSDAKDIQGGERVQLRGFSTSRHAVGTTVEYKTSGNDY